MVYFSTKTNKTCPLYLKNKNTKNNKILIIKILLTIIYFKKTTLKDI